MIDGKNNLSVPTIIFSQFLSFEWYEKRTNMHHSFACQNSQSITPYDIMYTSTYMEEN